MNTQPAAKTTAQRLLLQLIKLSDTGSGGWRSVRAARLADTLGYSPRTTRDILALFLDHDIVCLAGNDRYAIQAQYATDRAALVAAFDAIPFAPIKTSTNKPARKEPNMTTKTNTRATGAATPNGTCYCGCDSNVGKRSRFAAGHDARYISQLVAYLIGAKDADIAAETERIAGVVRTSFGNPLADKFVRAAGKAIERRDAAAAKAAAKRAPKAQGVEATYRAQPPIKIGRWTYPVREIVATGAIERNTKRDATGEWVPVP